jgi:bifunctional non-homologous end joining protein LigD
MSGTSVGAPAQEWPIAISNPDKVLWPDEGYTKLDLIEYYAAIFPKLAPYVEDRILSLERCPDGMNGECFYQKELPAGMPPDTPTKRIETPHGKRKSVNYVVGGSLTTQLALTNLGCIAVHVMAGRASAPRQSDWCASISTPNPVGLRMLRVPVCS